MAEYLEREALMRYPIRIDHYDKEHGNEHFVLGIESVLEYARSLPSADVAPVVRCGQCKHSRELDRKDPYESAYVEGCLWCLNGRGDGVMPDQYCDEGERKEG